MTTHFHVGLIGFNEQESQKIKSILQITQTRPRSYSAKPLAENSLIDLVFINNDTDSLPTFNDFQSINPDVAVISFSKKNEANYAGSEHIKGMLLATKVIKALDSLSIPVRGNQHSLPPSIAVKSSLESPINTGKLQVEEPIDNTKDTLENKFKVLVIDDSEVMQKSLALELANSSHATAVDFADCGETALQMIKNKHYDFIFLDVMMPGIDGFETCTEIRKIENMKKTPVIMLSAKTSPLDEVKGVMAGCSSYLTKPIQSDEFQKMLNRVMTWLHDFKPTKTAKEA
ncbi:MAG: response regulator [Methylococcaceae bacterium]|nr:response regulator [Methylococcaceae bacterium]